MTITASNSSSLAGHRPTARAALLEIAERLRLLALFGGDVLVGRQQILGPVRTLDGHVLDGQAVGGIQHLMIAARLEIGRSTSTLPVR